MTDLHKAVSDALARVAEQHGAQVTQPAQPARPARVERRPAEIDRRDSLAALRQPAGRQKATAEQRKLEGRYADVSFAEGYVTCLIHTIEWKAGAMRAYVMRLDRRSREYVTLDRLTNLRDED